MADICNQDRSLLPGVDIDIKLWPTHDEFRLITHPQGLKCKLIIDEIYLNVCKVSVNPEVMTVYILLQGLILVHLIYQKVTLV